MVRSTTADAGHVKIGSRGGLKYRQIPFDNLVPLAWIRRGPVSTRSYVVRTLRWTPARQ